MLYNEVFGDGKSSNDVYLKSLEDQEQDKMITKEQVDFKHLSARLLELEDHIPGLGAVVGMKPVAVGKDVDHDPHSLATWQVAKVEGKILNYPAYLIFNKVSMLESLQDSVKLTDDKTQAQGMARKGGYNSLKQSRALLSYQVFVPSLFSNKEEDPFGKISTCKKWDRQNGLTGLIPFVNKKLASWRLAHVMEINSVFPATKMPEVNVLLKSLLESAINFWNKKDVWITQFYNILILGERRGVIERAGTVVERKKMEKPQEEVEEEAWCWILLIIIDLYHEFLLRQSTGSTNMEEQGSVEEFAAYLFVALRVTKYEEELLLKDFKMHPTMSLAFNSFLFKQRAFKRDIHCINGGSSPYTFITV